MQMARQFLVIAIGAIACYGCSGPTSPPMWIDPNAPAVPSEKFAPLTGKETLGELVRQLGPAHEDIGSGAYVLVWRSADGRHYLATVMALEQSARPTGAGFGDN